MRLKRKKTIIRLMLGLLLLFAVSAYRRYSLIHLGDRDALRPYIMYTVYISMIAYWVHMIQDRVTSRLTRFYMMCDGALMVFWITTRLFQDTIIQNNLEWLRWSWYLVDIVCVLIPLFGLYAAFGLGRSDEYRLPKAFYLLWIPGLTLLILAMTDRYHHFMCYINPDEERLNLMFHPYIGTYLIVLWALSLIIVRVFILVKRNRAIGNGTRLGKLFPYMEAVLLLLYTMPYLASGFEPKAELIEFSAGIFVIEAYFWEICIYIGLVPVNVCYEVVFANSSVAMQIMDEEGNCLVRSRLAEPLSGETYDNLRREGMVAMEPGRELHLYGCGENRYMVWQKDITDLQSKIDILQQSSDALRQETELLKEEVRVRTEETQIMAKNRIYDTLSHEVSSQLELLRKMLAEQSRAEDRSGIFRKMMIVGLYIKRRCNLRLIWEETGQLSMEDVIFSFRDSMNGLMRNGVRADVENRAETWPKASFSLFCYDVAEMILEDADFSPERIHVCFRENGSCEMTVVPGRSGGSADGVMNRVTACTADGIDVEQQALTRGYRLILREGGNA